jgi:hypothetical protein
MRRAILALARAVRARDGPLLRAGIQLGPSRVGGREGESFISPKVQEERCRALADIVEQHDRDDIVVFAERLDHLDVAAAWNLGPAGVVAGGGQGGAEVAGLNFH